MFIFFIYLLATQLARGRIYTVYIVINYKISKLLINFCKNTNYINLCRNKFHMRIVLIRKKLKNVT